MSPGFNDTCNLNYKGGAQSRFQSQWGDTWMKIMNEQTK